MSYRTYDGSDNNLTHPTWGAADTDLLRQSDSAYSDGLSALAVRGPLNPNPRAVSNTMCEQKEPEPNRRCLTDMFWVWGQFVDHELDLTPEGGTEQINVVTPANDPVLPNATIHITRSIFNPATGTTNPREQINTISAYMDSTNVYGFNEIRAAALRTFTKGHLKTSCGDNGEILLPLNVDNLPNAILPGTDPYSYFLAGDVRANENVLLTSLHTVFVREHNRLADELHCEYPTWDDEKLYQQARKIVGAQQQVITYREFLPEILGCCPDKLLYRGYKTGVNASIKTEFSTAGYRLGHSMLNHLLRAGRHETLELRNAFFQPSYVKEHGIERLLKGATKELMQHVDIHIVEDVRSFLFGAPNPVTDSLLDLATLNIQRARDHGIADYNTVRQAYGLPAISSFAEISSNPVIQQGLEEMYGGVDYIDLWVGGLCEDHVKGALVGPTFWAIISEQFIRLRDGDRFWYKNDPALSKKWKKQIKHTTLGDIIRRNTDLKYVPRDVFHKQ